MTIQKMNEIREELEGMDFITCSNGPSPIETAVVVTVEYLKEDDASGRFISSRTSIYFDEYHNRSINMSVSEVLSELLSKAESVDEFGLSF